MHYRNGRVAQEGDQVVDLQSGHSGILYAIQHSESCNGRLASKTPGDPYVTVGHCVHIDDVCVAFSSVPPKT